ncbi:MAG: dihydropteroate synthase [Candidatus Omnitrophica bacterium]|nr:dihydropteroate synthase [Candidatus Omnitrophota bacterium]
MRKLNLTEPTTRQADLAFSKRTYVMGVLNVTPDSFSDGGKFLDKSKAIEHAIDMAAAGADMIDVGGVSTRPGARDVSIDEELGRVIPVLENLSKVIKIPISIDTRRSRVAEEAIRGGASIVNDVSGLRHDPAMAPVVARHGAAVIIMHMKGEPQNMQLNPAYKNLIEELIAFFRESINIARDAGVQEEKIIIDPGIGFGKTVEHNLEILNRLDEFKILGRPICIGTSRKSFIGKILDVSEPGDRLIGTLATCVIAVMKGANILRVHDVKETLQAARMTDSILKSKIKNL